MAVISEPEEKKEPSRVNIFLNDKDKAVEGLSDVGLGKTVLVTLQGVVKSVNSPDWNDGVDMTIEPSSVKVTTDDQDITLDDAIVDAEKRV